MCRSLILAAIAVAMLAMYIIPANVRAQILEQDKQVILQSIPGNAAWLTIQMRQWERIGNPEQKEFAAYYADLIVAAERNTISESQLKNLIVQKFNQLEYQRKQLFYDCILKYRKYPGAVGDSSSMPRCLEDPRAHLRAAPPPTGYICRRNPLGFPEMDCTPNYSR